MRNRTHPVQIYLNDDEYELLERNINSCALTTSQYIRILIEHQSLYEGIPPDYKEIYSLLLNIAVNVMHISNTAKHGGKTAYSQCFWLGRELLQVQGRYSSFVVHRQHIEEEKESK